MVQRMLEKYKKIYPNISDYSIMHFIDIAEFCDLIMDRQKLEDLNGDECYCLFDGGSVCFIPGFWFKSGKHRINDISKLGIPKSRRSRFHSCRS
mgnify:CR=1 FL=1